MQGILRILLNIEPLNNHERRRDQRQTEQHTLSSSPVRCNSHTKIFPVRFPSFQETLHVRIPQCELATGLYHR